MGRFSQLVYLCCVTGILLLLAPAASRADEQETLILRNGQTWAGISRGIEGGMLRWEKPAGEVVTIPLDDIERIEHLVPLVPPPAPPEESVDGSPEPTPAAEDSTVVPAAEAPAESVVATEVHEMGRFESVFSRAGASIDETFGYCDTWTKRLEVGGRLLHGNTEEDFFNTGLLLEKRADKRFTQIDAGGQYSRSRRVATSNRWFVNGTMDFNKQAEEKWVWFAASKNEYDEFENLSYRGSLSTGLGYRFFNEPKRRLITRIGPGVTYERFNDPIVNRVTPDLFGELESVWPLYDRTSLEHKTSIYPSLDDLSVFRFVSTSGLLIALDEGEHWTLKFGLRHEYNSRPNTNREKSDYTASVLLVYTRN